MYIAWRHCHNCSHHCQTYQRQAECLLHQGHANPNQSREPYFRPSYRPFDRDQLLHPVGYIVCGLLNVVAVDSIRCNIDFIKVESLQKGMFNSFA